MILGRVDVAKRYVGVEVVAGSLDGYVPIGIVVVLDEVVSASFRRGLHDGEFLRQSIERDHRVNHFGCVANHQEYFCHVAFLFILAWGNRSQVGHEDFAMPLASSKTFCTVRSCSAFHSGLALPRMMFAKSTNWPWYRPAMGGNSTSCDAGLETAGGREQRQPHFGRLQRSNLERAVLAADDELPSLGRERVDECGADRGERCGILEHRQLVVDDLILLAVQLASEWRDLLGCAQHSDHRVDHVRAEIEHRAACRLVEIFAADCRTNGRHGGAEFEYSAEPAFAGGAVAELERGIVAKHVAHLHVDILVPLRGEQFRQFVDRTAGRLVQVDEESVLDAPRGGRHQVQEFRLDDDRLQILGGIEFFFIQPGDALILRQGAVRFSQGRVGFDDADQLEVVGEVANRGDLACRVGVTCTDDADADLGRWLWSSEGVSRNVRSPAPAIDATAVLERNSRRFILVVSPCLSVELNLARIRLNQGLRCSAAFRGSSRFPGRGRMACRTRTAFCRGRRSRRHIAMRRRDPNVAVSA